MYPRVFCILFFQAIRPLQYEDIIASAVDETSIDRFKTPAADLHRLEVADADRYVHVISPASCGVEFSWPQVDTHSAQAKTTSERNLL